MGLMHIQKRREIPIGKQIDPDHRPSALEKRVTTRHKSWNFHWAWAAFGFDVAVTLETELAQPLSESERQAHMRRMLDAGQ